MRMPALVVDEASLGHLKERIDRFARADDGLSGGEVYDLLEQSTMLRELQTKLREGSRNRTRSGAQQTYADHNRLLLLGLDRLVDGDLAWYRQRLVDPADVDDDRLTKCFAAVRALRLTAEMRAVIWLAAALHDCGMLADGGTSIDVEDGVALASDVLDRVCPPHLRGLATFAVRHHDYIKDVFRGEITTALVARDLADLEPALQPAALAILGMIQVAGAASLGEGRLSRFRLDIFDRCASGGALDDETALTRLARLLSAEDAVAPTVDEATAERVEPLRPFLDRAQLHGWHRTWDATRESDAELRFRALAVLATCWADGGVDHMLLQPGLDLTSTKLSGTEPVKLLNGTVVAVIASR
jgi:hypothetical protein